MDEISRILDQLQKGEQVSSDDLVPIVYEELKRIARTKLSQERDKSLAATALVHEAYLRLVGESEKSAWNSRGHFYSAAAEAMRRILVDRARKRGRLKRGGNLNRVELDVAATLAHEQDDNLVALDEVLQEFEKLEPEKAELVKLRYFTGLTVIEAAEVLKISRSTAKRNWIYARAWLMSRLGDKNNE